MKELVSKQLVRYLEGRGVTHIFGLCGHTNIAVLTEIGKSSHPFRQLPATSRSPPTAADGYARVTKQAGVVLSHLGTGPHQRRHRRRHRGAGFHSHGGDRGRYPHPFLRQASASGDQSPRRRRPDSRSTAVRQTRLAGGPCRPVARDHRQGIPSGGKRPSGPGAGLGADGYFLRRNRHRLFRARQVPTRQAMPSRRSTRRWRKRSSPCCWPRRSR